MRCPRCSSDQQTLVLTIRHRVDGSIRRRHTCAHCEIRWTAVETIEPGTVQKAPLPRRLAGAD